MEIRFNKILTFLVESHLILFLLLLLLQLIHYLLIKKYDRDNTKKFLSIRKNEWIVIFISFLLAYLLNVSNEIINVELSISFLFSWGITIIFIIKEMNNILILMRDKGAYVPEILFKTLDSLDGEIEGKKDEENSN